MSAAAWAWSAFAVGSGLVAFGLSPLAGTTVAEGVSERGCLSAIAGIAIVCAGVIGRMAG